MIILNPLTTSPQVSKVKPPHLHKRQVTSDILEYINSQIKPNLFDQYPDLYWSIVFEYWSRYFTRAAQDGTVCPVPPFLDHHGFCPLKDQLTTGDRNRDTRARVQQLWDLWNRTERTAEFRVDQNATVLVSKRYKVVSEPLFISATTNPDPESTDIVLSFKEMYNFLRTEINNFADSVIKNGKQPDFKPLPVYRTRIAFTHTLYRAFKQSITEVGHEAAAINSRVNDLVTESMNRLRADRPLGLITLREMFRLFTQSAHFREHHPELTALDPPFYLYLVNALKVIDPSQFGDQWNVRITEAFDQDPPQFLANGTQVTILPDHLPDPVKVYLRKVAIVPDGIIYSVLIEYLVRAMVDYTQNVTLTTDRTAAVQALPGQQKFDPIEVRSKIIWLSVVQLATQTRAALVLTQPQLQEGQPLPAYQGGPYLIYDYGAQGQNQEPR